MNNLLSTTASPMQSQVFRLGHDCKVGRVVVGLDSINVMDNLGAKKLPPKNGFHNFSVVWLVNPAALRGVIVSLSKEASSLLSIPECHSPIPFPALVVQEAKTLCSSVSITARNRTRLNLSKFNVMAKAKAFSLEGVFTPPYGTFFHGYSIA